MCNVFYGSYFELFNELGSIAESNIAEIRAKKKRLNELMNLYGENRIDIENKATNAEYMEYILAEPYVKDELISDINKDLKNNLYGAMLGLKNKNADCRVLLNDRRTRNMKNENIY